MQKWEIQSKMPLAKHGLVHEKGDKTKSCLVKGEERILVVGELRVTVFVGDEAKFGLIYSILFKVLCDQERKEEGISKS